MYKLLEDARREGMQLELQNGGTILVTGKWNTPTAQRLADALRNKKPQVLAWMRSLSSFVGETITADVWLIVGERASREGWKVEARAVKGGVKIVSLQAPVSAAEQAEYLAPWEEPVELDPNKDYIIDEKTGRFVEVPGGVDWRPVLASLTAKLEAQGVK